jgi:hypothetical protein
VVLVVLLGVPRVVSLARFRGRDVVCVDFNGVSLYSGTVSMGSAVAIA